MSASKPITTTAKRPYDTQEAIKQFLLIYENPKISDSNLNLSQFKCYRTLGQGSFGRVILAYLKETRKFYALKLLKKEIIIKNKQIEHILNEKRILYACRHPNIGQLYFTFKDNTFLYFGLEYAIGGNLYDHLKAMTKFTEATAKFYICQILSCFDYLHLTNTVYRDLKPENVLINSKGYLKLIDFGFAKRVDKRTYTLCGTPDYLSPEMLRHQPYGKSVDYWSLGIFCYELNAGETPFKGNDYLTLYRSIVSGRFRCPKHFSSDLKDLCQNLLSVNITQRLGCLKRGTLDIIDHKWFYNVKWNAIYEQKLKAPFIPPIKSHLMWAFEKTKKREEPIHISAQESYTEYFENF